MAGRALDITKGGTGQTTAEGARIAFGLGPNDDVVFNSLTVNSLTAGSMSLTGDLDLNGNDIQDGGDIFLQSGKKIDWGTGDVIIQHAANALTFSGANTYTFDGGSTQVPFIIQQTDDGASAGPNLRLERISTNPAVSDLIGSIDFVGRDSLGAQQRYARLSGHILDPTSGGEDGTLRVNLTINAVDTAMYSFDIAAFRPITNDVGALGTSSTSWADLFLASGAVINWNAGDMTLTHSADLLTFAGGGVTFNGAMTINGLGNGLVAHTGSGAYAARTLTAPAAGITVSNGDGVSGNPTLALANDLSGLEGLSSNGFAYRTATDTWSSVASAMGQCYLTVSGGNLLLSRENGKYIFVDGVPVEIPSSGPTLSPTGITTTGGVSSTAMYYIYAYVTGGTLTLERSTTAYATDSTYGHKIKSGDSTRTFVGAWMASGADTWSTIEVQGVSWFNPKPKFSKSADIDATTSSGSTVEISSSLRVTFIALTGRLIHGGFTVGLSGHSGAAQNCFYTLGIDGVSTVAWTNIIQLRTSASTASHFNGIHLFRWLSLSEGVHYITPGHQTSSATLTSTNVETDVTIWG